MTDGGRRLPPRRRDPQLARVAVAVAAGLALADASIVVLALPAILSELEASVEAVAAVIGAYTLALGLALVAASCWSGRPDAATLGWAGMLGFAAASAGCGLAPSIELLIALRAAQGVAAAAVLLAAFDLLAAGRARTRGRSLWTAAAILGAALGPALGGTLTEVLDWRAIFLVQAPVVAVAALVAHGAPYDDRAVARRTTGGELLSMKALCLGLLSAALTGVLFLVVLLLISGWGLSPLEAAAVVSVLPLATFLGTRLPGEPAPRALVGSVLVGAGVLSLAFLPLDTVEMTIVPQLTAGLGMGMALPALAGGLLPERSSRDAANLLAVRQLGIAFALALLSPLAAAQLDIATEQVRERGTALILDAELSPSQKLDLAAVAGADLEAIAPRNALRRSLEQARHEIGPEDLEEYDRLTERADETLVSAINEAFAPTLLVCGGLAWLAAAGLLLSTGVRLPRRALAACALAVVLVPTQAAMAAATKPDPVPIRDPCAHRVLPRMDGLAGRLQEGVLRLLDQAACLLGSSREELVLTLIRDRQAGNHGDESPLRALLEELLER